MKQASHMNAKKKKKSVWFHLHEVSKVVRLVETVSRMAIANGWRESGEGNYCLMSIESQFYKVEVLDIVSAPSMGA